MKKHIATILAALVLSPALLAQTTRELTNLVVFVRFADDEEIDFPLGDIDTMFNGRTPRRVHRI